IHLHEIAGNLYVNQIVSGTVDQDGHVTQVGAGDVTVRLDGSGSIVDANDNEARDPRTEEQLLRLWQKMRATEDSAQQAIDATVSAYENVVTKEYHAYWSYRQQEDLSIGAQLVHGGIYFLMADFRGFSVGGVSNLANTISLGAGHGLTTGTTVTYRTSPGATAIGGLTEGATYTVEVDEDDPSLVRLIDGGGEVVDLDASAADWDGHRLELANGKFKLAAS